MKPMKKICQAAALTLILGATVAHADQRLFPTDILNEGEVDLFLGTAHSWYSRPVQWRGQPGTQKFDGNGQTIEGRYGLGSDWHIGASIHYTSTSKVQTHYQGNSFTFLNTSGDGLGNPHLFAKYAFVGGNDAPFSLTGVLGVTPQTTGDSPTAFDGVITGGWSLGNGLKLYSTYEAVHRNTSRYGVTQVVSAGAHQALGEELTLTAGIQATRGGAGDVYTAYHNHGFSVSAIVRVLPNTYLVPAFDLTHREGNSTQDGLMHWGATDAKGVALRLYHLM